VIGEGKVIAGWDLALRTMAVGEAVELKVASSLGYGDEGSPGSTKAETIPPGATLLFTVEFVSIKEGLKSTRAQEDRERLLELRKEREAKAKEASAAKEAKAARAAEAQARIAAKQASKGKKGKGGGGAGTYVKKEKPKPEEKKGKKGGKKGAKEKSGNVNKKAATAASGGDAASEAPAAT